MSCATNAQCSCDLIAWEFKALIMNCNALGLSPAEDLPCISLFFSLSSPSFPVIFLLSTLIERHERREKINKWFKAAVVEILEAFVCVNNLHKERC